MKPKNLIPMHICLEECRRVQKIRFFKVDLGPSLLYHLDSNARFLRWIDKGQKAVLMLAQPDHTPQNRIYKVYYTHVAEQRRTGRFSANILENIKATVTGKSYRDGDAESHRFLRGVTHQEYLESELSREFGHIPRIFLKSTNPLYCVMQHFPGSDLIKWCQDQNDYRESHEEVAPSIIRYFWNFFKLLQQIHDLGVVHRDIKEENMLVHRDFKPILLDFDEAKNIYHDTSVTGPMAQQGTPDVASPQHLDDFAACAECDDIYTALLTMWEAFTGIEKKLGITAPEAYKHPEKTYEIQQQNYPANALPRPFQSLYRKGTQEDRKRRYISLDELIIDYEKAMSNLGVGLTTKRLQRFTSPRTKIRKLQNPNVAAERQTQRLETIDNQKLQQHIDTKKKPPQESNLLKAVDQAIFPIDLKHFDHPFDKAFINLMNQIFSQNSSKEKG